MLSAVIDGMKLQKETKIEFNKILKEIADKIGKYLKEV